MALDSRTIDELRQLRPSSQSWHKTKKLDEFRGERGDYNDDNAIKLSTDCADGRKVHQRIDGFIL